MPTKDNKQRKDIMRALSGFTQLGVTMSVCVLAGVLFGRYLDGYFGTSPWLLLLFTICGIIAAFKSLYETMIGK